MADEKVKIKMLRSVTGSDAEGNPFTASAGSEVEVSPATAADFVRAEFSTVLSAPKQGKETATAKHLNKETR